MTGSKHSLGSNWGEGDKIICESALTTLRAASAFSLKRGKIGIEETEAELREGEAGSGGGSPSKKGAFTFLLLSQRNPHESIKLTLSLLPNAHQKQAEKTITN